MPYRVEELLHHLKTDGYLPTEQTGTGYIMDKGGDSFMLPFPDDDGTYPDALIDDLLSNRWIPRPRLTRIP